MSGLALLAVPFGLAIGLSLGMVGGGGSILAVPVLVYVLGEPVREATTSSLVIVGTTALAGGIAQTYARRVRVRLALGFGLAGALGAFAGTAANRVANPPAILLGFGLLMLAAAYVMVRHTGRTRSAGEPSHQQQTVRVGLAGAGVGALTGFFGVGGGFVIVPALVLLLGLDIAIAVGTSLLVISVTSASALVAHLASGTVDWAVTGAFTAAGIAGALCGARLGRRMAGERLTRIFALLVACLALFVIAKSVGTLT